MPEQKLAEAYSSWMRAFQNMGEVLTMTPVVIGPLRASAAVFDNFGRMLFGAANGARESVRKSAAARMSTQSRVEPKTRRRRRSSPKR